MRGRVRRVMVAGLAPLVVAGPSLADAAKPPPLVPSSYELRRVEAQIRQVLAARAAEAKRKSRQIEATGTGTAAGPDPDSGFALDLTAKQVVGLSLTALLGVVAANALSQGTGPTVVVGQGGAGAGAGPTTTGTK